MSSQDKMIPLTLRLDNVLYNEFHRAVEEHGATHTGILRLLIKEWLKNRKPKPFLTAPFKNRP
jgi:hypothetical protein